MGSGQDIKLLNGLIFRVRSSTLINKPGRIKNHSFRVMSVIFVIEINAF